MSVSDGVAALATRIATEFKSVRTALTGKASTTHAAAHASGGGDPVSPGSIGAAVLGHSHSPATPAAHASSHAPGASDPLPADQSAAIASVRTLGTGALQAAPGTAPVAAVTAHEVAGDPHSQYLTAAEGVAAFQGADIQLAALAALAGGADQLPYFTSTTVAAQTPLTTFARTLLDDADAATARTTLGAAPTAHTHGGGGYLTGTVPDGSTTPIVTHALGTTDVAAFVLEAGVWRPVVYEAISATQIRFTFTVAPTAGQYRYLLLAGAPASAQNVPVPPVNLLDAPTIATDAANGVHFVLGSMAADRILGAPTNPAPGQRVLWEITATGAPRSLTLTVAGARSFVPTDAAPDTVIAIPAGQSVVLGGMYSAARDRFLLLSQTVG